MPALLNLETSSVQYNSDLEDDNHVDTETCHEANPCVLEAVQVLDGPREGISKENTENTSRRESKKAERVERIEISTQHEVKQANEEPIQISDTQHESRQYSAAIPGCHPFTKEKFEDFSIAFSEWLTVSRFLEPVPSLRLLIYYRK